jgi:hypothetical protein
MATLEAKLFAAALATPALTALLGTNPFRWYNLQLTQGSAMPAVVVFQVSDPASYAFTGKLPTSAKRMQFTIWGDSAEKAQAVEAALTTFLGGFTAYGIPGLVSYANYVVNVRAGMYTQTQPARYLRILDAMILNNDLI